MEKEKACQLCGHTPLVEFVVPGRTNFWKCNQCGLYQYGLLPPMHCQEDPAYHHGYEKHYGRKLRTAKVRMNRIAGMFPDRPLRLLDVGCGIGAILDAARWRGWHPVGVDLSRRVVSICQNRGFECYAVNGHTLPFPDKSFDIVTAWSVIEHVVDVSETFAEWRRVLRDDGALVLDTSDATCLKAWLLGKNYRAIWVRGHIYTFTPSTLLRFAERAGFRAARPPFVGSISGLRIRDKCHAVAYQAQYEFRRALRIQRPFQMYLRPAG